MSKIRGVPRILHKHIVMLRGAKSSRDECLSASAGTEEDLNEKDIMCFDFMFTVTGLGIDPQYFRGEDRVTINTG